MPWFCWGMSHITIVTVTVFLHRHQAHRSLELHPALSHFFRFWLWMTTGMITKEWTAIHRKHHAKVETDEDPHSPQVAGIHKVLWLGVVLYIQEKRNKETIEKYGFGTPDDWLERNLYSSHIFVGILSLAAGYIALFGLIPGFIIWVTHMAWIPFWAAGVINGVGHYFGYRNFQSADESRNIIPLGLLIGGEELHNNHHAFPTSARLSNKWFEFDIGWLYIRLFQYLKLAKVKRVAPKLVSGDGLCDMDALNAVIANRFEIITRFAGAMKSTCIMELKQLQKSSLIPMPSRSTVKNWLLSRESRLDEDEKSRLYAAHKESKLLRRVHAMRQELISLWEDKEASAEQLMERFREWCRTAESSGIESLQRFAIDLRGFSSVQLQHH